MSRALLWLLVALGAVAVTVAVFGASIRERLWGSDARIAAYVATGKTLSGSYTAGVDLAAQKTGAPSWYVRSVSPERAVAAPCRELKRNPWKAVNYVLGYVGGAILSVIPVTAPAGALVLGAAASVDAALPAQRERPCR